MRSQLRRILLAYALFRPDIGYVRGMSHVTAVLMLSIGTLAREEDTALKVVAAPSSSSSSSKTPAPAAAAARAAAPASLPRAPYGGSSGGNGGMLFVPRSMRRDESSTVGASGGSNGGSPGGFAGFGAASPTSSPGAFAAKSAADETAVLARHQPQQPAEVVVFRSLTAIIVRLAPLRFVYARSAPQLRALSEVVRTALTRTSPRAIAALDKLGITLASFIEPWLASLFTRALGLEVSLRLWDRCIVGGAPEVVKAAVGLTTHLVPILESGCSVHAARQDILCVPATYRDEFVLLPLVDAVVLTPAELVALRGLEKVQ